MHPAICPNAKFIILKADKTPVLTLVYPCFLIADCPFLRPWPCKSAAFSSMLFIIILYFIVSLLPQVFSRFYFCYSLLFGISFCLILPDCTKDLRKITTKPVWWKPGGRLSNGPSLRTSLISELIQVTRWSCKIWHFFFGGRPQSCGRKAK